MDNQFKKAVEAYESENYKLSVSILEPMCAEENPDALSLLGVFYQLGLGVECDGIKAISLLERAVAQGKGEAAHNLGTIYCTGLPGVQADTELARSYYQKAKAMGAQVADDSFYEW
jgi:uncharacterized protein